MSESDIKEIQEVISFILKCIPQIKELIDLFSDYKIERISKNLFKLIEGGFSRDEAVDIILGDELLSLKGITSLINMQNETKNYYMNKEDKDNDL